MSLTKVTYSMTEGAPVNVLDFGVVGDGVTDDAAAIQAALDFASANKKAVVFPQTSGDYYIESSIVVKSDTTVYFESGNFIRILSTADVGQAIGLFGSNITCYNLKVDCDGGDNLNCVGISRAGTPNIRQNIRIIGGFFKNAIRTTEGGRGITAQFGVVGLTCSSFTVKNCTAAVDIHGNQDTDNYVYNCVFDNFTAEDCEEVASIYGLFDIGPQDATKCQMVVSNFTARNCGVITTPALGNPEDGGVFVSSRGCFMKVFNGLIVNDSGHGTSGGLFRGLGKGHMISNITFIGNVTTLFNHTHAPSSQGADNPNNTLDSFVAQNIRHYGSISGYIVEIDTSVRVPNQNCLYFDIQVDGGASLTGGIAGTNMQNTDCFGRFISRGDDNQIKQGNFNLIASGGQTNDFSTFGNNQLSGSVRIGPLTSYLSSGVASLGTTAADADKEFVFRYGGLEMLRFVAEGTRIHSSAWNERHLLLGNFHLWVDTTGDLRIKNGAPTSETDGTIVGTQS